MHEVSRENIELVRRLYGELASEGSTREFDQRLTDEALSQYLDPGIEWVPVAHSLLAVESYRGFDGVRRFWGEFVSAWESYKVEPLSFYDAGDQVAVRRPHRRPDARARSRRHSVIALDSPRWASRPGPILCRPRGCARGRRIAALARVDRFPVAIAEDLGEQYASSGSITAFCQSGPANAFRASTDLQCVTTTNSGCSLQRLCPAVTWVQPSWAFTMGIPVSITKRSNWSSFPG